MAPLFPPFPAWGLLPLLCLAPAASRAAVEFNRDIRPLLTKHCTSCHGGVKAAGKLSFILRDTVLAPAKSGETAVVPGRPAESELLRRVRSTDPDEVMPKPEHGPRLTEAEAALLEQWIAEGAPWSEHWSFTPPAEPPEPETADKSWGSGKADRLVLARLEAEGLKPSLPAPDAVWLRRVTLDLTGLPPSREDYAAFRKDQEESGLSPESARGRVVDRLLASPAFGERWAAVWLDLARYSDTFGFEKDPHRDIWPWRDWVIRALNADMPFDQFTEKQLAGDLLPDATGDNLLATAFHRNTQNNTEGGTDDEEYRTAAVIDRVNTTWTAWQATTFGCVQCHSHPYDPIPHRDYYRFAAFFDNTEDCDQNDDFPRLTVPGDPAKADEAARLTRETAALRQALNDAGAALMADAREAPLPLKPDGATATGGTLAIAEDGLVTASGTMPIGVSYSLTFPVPGGATALRLDILPEKDDPKGAPERGSVLSRLDAVLTTADGTRTPVTLREAAADFLAGPLDPDGILSGAGNGGFGAFPVLREARWCVIVPERPLPEMADARLELTLKQNAASNSGTQAAVLRKFRFSALRDPRWTALAADPARAALKARLQETRAALQAISGPAVPVLAERSPRALRDTRVFVRGNRLTLDESVQPGIPDITLPPKTTGRLTRLDLARWLTGPDNPLAARVLANRLWAELFGQGLVVTQEDFGTSGQPPSHPALLDHLALRLRDHHKWSLKAFLRELALSSTYAQDARVSPALRGRDPDNRLLARGPRNRLTAEMVRDQALALSGLLSAKMHGPPVYPPQPAGVWNTVYNGETWKTSEGEDRYRRAVYTYHKRTSGYPGFLTFDAPARDTCTARRLVTNTPLQALVTLNDPAFLEMAAALARRMGAGGGTPREKIARGCALVTLEESPPALVDRLTALHAQAVAEYTATPPPADFAPDPDTAALILVANTLLNTDPALNR